MSYITIYNLIFYYIILIPGKSRKMTTKQLSQIARNLAKKQLATAKNPAEIAQIQNKLRLRQARLALSQISNDSKKTIDTGRLINLIGQLTKVTS